MAPVLSPDAAVLRPNRWLAVTVDQRRVFAPLCPDLVVELVVELASPSGKGPRGITSLRRKMARYQANGARLGWLLLPEERAVEVCPASGEPRRIEQAAVLEAGAKFPGLQLKLGEIWVG